MRRGVENRECEVDVRPVGGVDVGGFEDVAWTDRSPALIVCD